MLRISITARKHLKRHMNKLHCALLIGLMGSIGSVNAKQVSIHDPVMAKEAGNYYLFSTGPGITYYASTDKVHWTLAGRVFDTEPTWARGVAPDFNGHLWAPDIIEHDGYFYLYYSISAFGKNTSAIGVAVNKTLDKNSKDYQWVDKGMVLESIPHRDAWNAIDPNIIVDEKGAPWMSFGSFWQGLKLVKLNQDFISLAKPEEWHTLAKLERPALLNDAEPGPAQIEAPFIYKKDDYYYLFVSYGLCCRADDSTYHLAIGRSTSVTGPYLDKEGKDMAQGGGSVLLRGTKAWPGLGHNSVYQFEGKDYLVFHAYESADKGLQKLKIAELTWNTQGWPVVDPNALTQYKSVLVDPIGNK
ncbi:Arabinan endo-1,5-alpha-L-arabinosidase [Shewanella sp. W3-18-1]|uniref:arabinan endo-1,5-alpha-L-arabinosidase n=1 Tax=Shewanella sp. (strain W3-18-1) TaxID=351745 RepID=UPI00005FDEC5|nr:arabinan endo-1,5-alpha-L-arabinosidase [Shewanella sp. W3-18-1]ABM24796.1 Arabinan endo-1,5-alpha-L-arabinosidase [Shewanella sp. W3-18-1]